MLVLIGIVFSSFVTLLAHPDWGFYGHRKINKYAVFTLPQEMLPLYKSNLTYLEEHAVDPDKRRYTTKYEAIRHYIDIDHWGTYPFDNVPKDFGLAITKFSDWIVLTPQGDSIFIDKRYELDTIQLWAEGDLLLKASHKDFSWFYSKNIRPFYYEDDWVLEALALDIFFNVNQFSERYTKLVVIDKFTDYGILPYYLEIAQRQLTNAFIDGDYEKVLRLSADFGHYIGDAHVPLHTTENYNGQMSNQVGIHAFWESRIPELFAEKEYNFFAGKAEYIDDKRSFFWDIVLSSHAYLDEVLSIEKRLSETYPSDQQYCYDERLNNTVRLQCPEYAAAYQKAMQGMVEERWSASIKAIGDAWYTAWVDAGQPRLSKEKVEVTPITVKNNKNIKTRSHDNDE